MNDYIKRIIDEKEINFLLIEYCRALDSMELEIIKKLFSKDCIVEFGTDKQLNSKGSDELIKSLERMWRWKRTSHHLSNVIINFKSHDIAFSKSYVLAWHQRFNDKTAIIYGQYHDEFLRDKDRWMITKRKMFMNGSDDNFKVKIFPFKRKIPPKNWVPPKIDES